MNNLLYAARGLRRSPAVSVVAVLSLAVGIGASTAIFSLANAVILRSLPVQDPGSLVVVRYLSAKGNIFDSFSYSDYQAFREVPGVLSGLAAVYPTEVNLASDEATERVPAEFVSGNYFGTLGVPARTGRLIQSEDDAQAGAHPVCVLSHSLWQRRFGSSPQVSGRQIQINGRSYTILGVAAERFAGMEQGRDTQIYLPLMMAPQVLTRRDDWLRCFGRRSTGVSTARAESVLDARFEQLPLAHRQTTFESSNRHGATGTRARLIVADGRQGFDNLRFGYERPLVLLLLLVGLLLAVTCTNVANLLLARAAGRRKETAIRMALGGGAGALLRQLLAESLVLAAAGASLGLLLSVWIADLLLRATPIRNDRVDVHPDLTVLAFVIGLTGLTTLIFGLAPAWAGLRAGLAPALKSTSGGSTSREGFLGSALVVAQVALSVTLLAGAGLLLHSLHNLQSIPTGLRPENVVLASLNPGASRYSETQSRALFTALMEQSEALPGVRVASAAQVSPLSGGLWLYSVGIPGYQAAPREVPMAYFNGIGPGYFAAIGTPLKAGREFTRLDRAGAPLVAVVNEEMVKKFWAGRDPIGQRIQCAFFDERPVEIVGVVRDSVYRDLRETKNATLYVPLLQGEFRSASLVLRVAGDPQQTLAQLNALARRIDAAVPLYGIRTLDAQIAGTLTPERMLALVSSILGALALLLATVGLYGVLAYAVTHRSREIGIRMALGAAPAQVIRSVIRDAARMVTIGLLLGIPLSLLTSRWIAASLYGLRPGDPVTYGSIVAILAAAALAAAFIPSRRAARVDPIVVLRCE
jgi:predicted permease